MLKILRYSLKKGILIGLIKIFINLIVIYSIIQIIDLLIRSNLTLSNVLYRIIPQSFDHNLVYFLSVNVSIFIGVYFSILIIYLVLERVFITSTLHTLINKVLLMMFILTILSHFVLNWSDLERSINSIYYNNLLLLLNSFLVHFLVNNLLFNVLRSLHRKLLKDVLDYPSLRKGATIRLLEMASLKRKRVEEQKKVRDQLEQKYLDDLKKLNSNR